MQPELTVLLLPRNKEKVQSYCLPFHLLISAWVGKLSEHIKIIQSDKNILIIQHIEQLIYNHKFSCLFLKSLRPTYPSGKEGESEENNNQLAQADSSMVNWFFGTYNQFSSRTKVYVQYGEVFMAARETPFKPQFTEMIYI